MTVWEALRKVGLEEKIESLPQGIHTAVELFEEGEKAMFSAGEGQRLALCRVCILYTSDVYKRPPLKSGSISYDKVLVSAERDCDYSNISVMPHEFGRYCLTVAENIGFDDADSVHPENFSLENWFLGKEYGGQELSGGQWQRVALYRCLHKDAEFYVLDEPTAYLDPSHEAEAVAEIDVYKRQEPDLAVAGNAQGDGAGQTAVGRHETYFGAAGI